MFRCPLSFTQFSYWGNLKNICPGRKQDISFNKIIPQHTFFFCHGLKWQLFFFCVNISFSFLILLLIELRVSTIFNLNLWKRKALSIRLSSPLLKNKFAQHFLSCQTSLRGQPPSSFVLLRFIHAILYIIYHIYICILLIYYIWSCYYPSSFQNALSSPQMQHTSWKLTLLLCLRSSEGFHYFDYLELQEHIHWPGVVLAKADGDGAREDN